MKDTQDNNQKTKTHKPGEKLKDKIRRHLRDKDDIITEEDIRDILNENKPPEDDSKGKAK